MNLSGILVYDFERLGLQCRYAVVYLAVTLHMLHLYSVEIIAFLACFAVLLMLGGRKA